MSDSGRTHTTMPSTCYSPPYGSICSQTFSRASVTAALGKERRRLPVRPSWASLVLSPRALHFICVYGWVKRRDFGPWMNTGGEVDSRGKRSQHRKWMVGCLLLGMLTTEIRELSNTGGGRAAGCCTAQLCA